MFSDKGFSGRNLIFNWNSANVAGVNEISVELGGDPINVTANEDNGWQTLINEIGEKTVTISISGVTRDETLRNDWFSGNRIQDLSVTFPDANTTLSGKFALASYSESGSFNEAITFESEFQSANTVIYS